MSDILNSLIMGIVEGITEFLPVSSTGHLIVTKELLKFQGSDTFEIVIQLGGVLAVLWFYFSTIWQQVKTVTTDKAVQRFWITVIIAFLPAAFVGLALQNYITEYLFNSVTVAISLIVGGIVMWWIEGADFRPRTLAFEQMTMKQGFAIGCAQLCALIPGVSRSASTIMGGMLTGLDRSTATGFSFFLSIPTLGAASIYSLLKDLHGVSEHGVVNISIGLATSFIVSLLSIGWLLRYISHHSFRGFAVYRIVTGLIILTLSYLGFFSSSV
ncbi:undecaprenyl-diphosphate phosphatase [Tolumonas lignilytica]|uniref:undecaprenyl-diphosphate phosphatase n=1 Tax=Tolumonas lignilytica TaxID=1283284 RepID=UPI0004635DEB|nr:undecaprenyl-diphosphate phosphatase [Tolumonas lignilytica]